MKLKNKLQMNSNSVYSINHIVNKPVCPCGNKKQRLVQLYAYANVRGKSNHTFTEPFLLHVLEMNHPF